jgi:hypothetical protein
VNLSKRNVAYIRQLAEGLDPHVCWLWPGYIGANGYGYYRTNERNLTAHRVSYTIFIGPIPDGQQLDHRCRVRACWNPHHLDVVSPRENTQRGLPFREKRARPPLIRCHRGHDKKPGRRCLICHRERMAALRTKWGGRKAPLGAAAHPEGGPE